MNNFADNYIIANSKYLPADKLPFIRERLAQIPEDRQVFLSALDFQDPTMMLIISFFAGGLGLDRFLIGGMTLGILKLITVGGCGIWAIIDLFLIMNATREANFNKLMRLI